MSTRSTIKIRRVDGTETGIYCHWDGYIEGVGVTLQLAYNTAEKLEELLKLGDLSALRYKTAPNPEFEHSFEAPQEDVCIAYCRDRGEAYHQSNGDNEYVYTFDEYESVWYVERETIIQKTAATNMLALGYFAGTERKLLLDAIIESEANTLPWRDDEYAKAGKVVEACIEKAREARRSSIESSHQLN